MRAAKILFGKRFNFPIGDKIGAALDLNFGFGIREKEYIDAIDYFYDGYNAQYYDPAEIEAKSHVVPSLDLGAKLGIGF